MSQDSNGDWGQLIGFLKVVAIIISIVLMVLGGKSALEGYSLINFSPKIDNSEVARLRAENEALKAERRSSKNDGSQEPCVDCAVDMQAEYVGAIVRNGTKRWQYRASNGVVYSMTVDRKSESDMIRLSSDGNVSWVTVTHPIQAPECAQSKPGTEMIPKPSPNAYRVRNPTTGKCAWYVPN